MTDERAEFQPLPDSEAEAGVAPAPQPESSPWWRQLLGLMFGSAKRQQERLRELDDAIALSPASAANYTLRGELYLRLGEPAAARRDFQRALALAEAQIESSNWGIVVQAVVDRAQRGLAQAEKQVARAVPPQPDTSMVDGSGERLTDDIPSGTSA